jgi:spore germination cell wall hydrolase CwlJ-like protein
LLLIKYQTRASARALGGAVLVGSALGLLLGGSYLAGGAARAAASHARTERLASAAAQGFSEQALKAEVSALPPGAQAVARRHDPVNVAGAAQRDRDTALMAARLAPAHPAQNTAHPPLLRASLTAADAPARVQPAVDTKATSSRDLDCLSQAVYYEARGESQQGQAAVAQVVLNRTRHAGFPKTVCGVVFQGAQSAACQFSFACDGSMRRPREREAWAKARKVAAGALTGKVKSPVGDATHFHVASLGGVWGSSLVKVAQVGAHVFYKLTGRAAPAASSHDAPELLAAAADLSDRVYARPQPTAPVQAGPGASLILAAAVSPAPAAPAAPKATEAPAKPAAEKVEPAATAAMVTNKAG